MKTDFGQTILRKYLRWITNPDASGLVIGLIALITALLATQLGNLRIYVDPDKTLPPNHPLIVLGNRIQEIFGGKYVMVISVEVKACPAKALGRPGKGPSSILPRCPRCRESRTRSGISQI